MNTKKDKKEETKIDTTIQEIIEIARLAKSVRETVDQVEDKTRPIIASKNYGDEIKILHYTH